MRTRAYSPVAAIVAVMLLPLSSCSDDDTAGTAPLPRETSSPSPAPSPEVTRAGLTVRLPAGCDAGAVSRETCQGLRSLTIARIGALDDLMRPGVHRQGPDDWVGLQVVDSSYVFATADNRSVLRDVLDSTARE